MKMGMCTKAKLPDDPPHPIVPYEQWYKGERVYKNVFMCVCLRKHMCSEASVGRGGQEETKVGHPCSGTSTSISVLSPFASSSTSREEEGPWSVP